MSIVLDHPTRANTAAPNPLLWRPMFLMLREQLARHGEITIRMAHLAGRMGLREFAARTAYVEHTLTDADVRWTLVHELLHNLYGPAGQQSEAIEEARIEAAVAAVMLDAAASLALAVKAERQNKDVEKVDTPRARQRIVDGIERLLAGAR